MTSPRFDYQVDVASGEVHIRLWDYWQDSEGEAYREAMAKATQQLAHRNHWVTLVDISRSPPQSVTVQRIRQEVLTAAKLGGMVKIAYVVDSALTRNQVSRLNSNAGTEALFFTERNEALVWLRKKT